MPAHQRGFTLVELLVGLALGLMVVITALTSLVFTQSSAKVVGDAARLQQRADLIFRIMGFHAQQAGALAVQSSALDPSRLVFNAAFTGFDPAVSGQAYLAVHGVEGNNAAPDTLRVSYQDDGMGRDCLGNTTALPGIRVDNSFTVDGQNQFVCTGANAATGAQPIAEGIEDFQVRYGVLTSAPAWSVQYLSANAMTALTWPQVASVSVCLQMSGDQMGNAAIASTINGCDGAQISGVTPSGQMRRVYRRVFALQNAL